MGIGSILPTLISWVTSYHNAEIFKTYAVPKAEHFFDSKHRKSFLNQVKQIWIKTNKNVLKTLYLNYSIQLVLCSMVLYLQQNQYIQHIENETFTQTEINQIKNSNKIN